MMKSTLIATLALMTLGAPALAAGDAAAGEADFKKCKACHSVIADDGTVIQKGGKIGPNLYGVIGRPVAGTDFKYSAFIKTVGESGLVWDEAELASYVTDPTAWLKDKTGDAKAKSKMAFKLGAGQEDIAAYLASLTAQ